MRKKFKMICEQIRQYRELGKYGDHYFENIIRILFGKRIIDYRNISHENKVVHSYIYGMDDEEIAPGLNVDSVVIGEGEWDL